MDRVYIIRSGNGAIWGASLDRDFAESEVRRMGSIYAEGFFIETVRVIEQCING